MPEAVSSNTDSAGRRTDPWLQSSLLSGRSWKYVGSCLTVAYIRASFRHPCPRSLACEGVFACGLARHAFTRPRSPAIGSPLNAPRGCVRRDYRTPTDPVCLRHTPAALGDTQFCTDNVGRTHPCCDLSWLLVGCGKTSGPDLQWPILVRCLVSHAPIAGLWRGVLQVASPSGCCDKLSRFLASRFYSEVVLADSCMDSQVVIPEEVGDSTSRKGNSLARPAAVHQPLPGRIQGEKKKKLICLDANRFGARLPFARPAVENFATRRNPFFCHAHRDVISRKWKSGRTMPLVGEFSRGSPVSPTLSFRRCSVPASLRPRFDSRRGFMHLGIVPDDSAGRRLFSGISRFPRPFTPVLIHILRFNLIGAQDPEVKEPPKYLHFTFHAQSSQEGSGFTSMQQPTEKTHRLQYVQHCKVQPEAE
ncbi:hypothetical protein PR048_030536 [Dryococelus australis]|uniref:Uncharacterized protein n=1 Tax=Dryococelus australis TaxID=614101 RepID=A0ABQ9G992_9NEOP|nr:hypothetical protein PR048_030536 [Dryococelus australis]